MKSCIKLLIFLVLSGGCKSDVKMEAQDKINIEIKKQQPSCEVEVSGGTNSEYEVPPVNFLEEKYKKNGFVLPDSTPSFPSYTFFDKELGGFSVNYIGKSRLIQDYWLVSNKVGFFSQFEDTDQIFENSKEVSNKVNAVLINNISDYYIIADFLPKEAISKYYNDVSGEFDLKNDAYTYFYIYENNKWIFIKRLLTVKIAGEGISLYNDLLLFHGIKKI
jgi:hypothetical protein